MGTNREEQDKPEPELQEKQDVFQDGDEQKLLESILRDAMGGANSEALKLVFQVAKASSFPDTSHIGAVEEFVRAVIRRRFGGRKFPAIFINRIACSLIEVPEAAVKFERLWQEARSGG